MWCQYCDKNNHNTADCRELPKLNSRKRLNLKPKLEPGKKYLACRVLLEEIYEIKRQLKPKKTASSKKRKAESILFSVIILITRSDEGDNKENLFTSSKPFSSSKTKLEKSSNLTINH
jgi:hypothetical protein